jgi:cysteine rich repeat protein
MRRSHLAQVFALLAVFIAAPALAQDLRKACEQDARSLCGGAQAGGGILKCLKDNEGKLSAPCRSAVTNLLQSAADCRPDAKRLCSTVTSGGSAVVECLKAHKAELSKACAARLDSMAKQN